MKATNSPFGKTTAQHKSNHTNQTTHKPFFKKAIQPKIAIGEPGGYHEREADAIADRVVSQSETKGLKSDLVNQITPINSQIARQSTNQVKATQAPATNLQQTLANNAGKGNALESGIKGEMESAFGADFSAVRIHTDGAANNMNNQLGANAFAYGNDVFFRSNKYNPSSQEGKRLLAHELTHTIQQKGLGGSDMVERSIIQGEKIRYRTITWADFELEAPEGSSHDAAVFSGVELAQGDNWISSSWSQTSDTDYTATITFNRDDVSLFAYMETTQSWKSAWLTDDEAARRKLGPSGNIPAARSALLAHEQLHFTNARTAASAYEQEVKNALPATAYTENFTAADNAAANARTSQILNTKAQEVNTAIDAIIERANAEMNKVQGIYDTDTNHSQNETAQQRWRDHYQDAYNEARDRDLSQSATGDAEHADEHEHESE